LPALVGDRTTIELSMQKLHVPGVSVAVVDSGRVAWVKGYGVADAASNRPVTPETRFQAGSVSKPVASMAALRMVDDGQLKLDEDVNPLLRSWKVPTNTFTRRAPVTLRELLTHTAGVTVSGFAGYQVGDALPSIPQELNGTGLFHWRRVRVDVTP